MELYFVTGNSSKIKSAQACFDKMCLPIVVKQCPIKLTEIQAMDATEISQAKAKEAFAEVKAPLVVEDSGFHINALNGFPGVYVRYVLDTIGAEGIIKQMEGIDDRSCQFIAVTTFIYPQRVDFLRGVEERAAGVYTRYMRTASDEDNNVENSIAKGIDGSGKLISFRGTGGKGTIAKKLDENDNPLAWSDLWKIYIPEGYNKPLSAFSEKDVKDHYNGSSKKKGSLSIFAEWLSKNLECLEKV